MVVKNSKASIKVANSARLTKVSLTPIRLAKATLTPIRADFQCEMQISVKSASDFHKLLADETLFVSTNGNAFFFHKNGILLTTQSFGLNWKNFHRLSVKDFSGLQGILKFRSTAAVDPNGFAVKAWNTKERVLRQKYGGHQLLSEPWCASSDFSSRENLESAVRAGFLTQREMAAASKEGFDQGPLYYLAKEMGFKKQDDIIKALSLGISDAQLYNYIKRGKFVDTGVAIRAKQSGFKNLKDWDEAQLKGCSNPAELKALKKHGWGNLQIYRTAISRGFKDSESELHMTLSKNNCFQPLWSSISNQMTNANITNARDILVKIRQNPKVLKEMQTSNVDYFWQALILLKLRELAPGSSISFNSLKQASSTIRLNHESFTNDTFREFIYHHPSVHHFGSAVPADGEFQIRKKKKV